MFAVLAVILKNGSIRKILRNWRRNINNAVFAIDGETEVWKDEQENLYRN